MNDQQIIDHLNGLQFPHQEYLRVVGRFTRGAPFPYPNLNFVREIIIVERRFTYLESEPEITYDAWMLDVDGSLHEMATVIELSPPDAKGSMPCELMQTLQSSG